VFQAEKTYAYIEVTVIFNTFHLRYDSEVQDPNEVNEDNLSNVRQEASRHSRNKKREYLKKN
jgi:hypothetical protein